MSGRASPKIAALVALYAVSTLVGAALFAALMRLWTLAGPGVMFYRGVAALAVTGLALLVAGAIALPRLPPGAGLDAADALGGAIVATSLLLAFFVLGPVTVDRSVSIFMLSQFEAAGGELTADAARQKFVTIYLGDWDQIGRRLSEQRLSGNLERDGDKWRLTPQGERFMDVARTMSAWFGGDPRFVGRAN